MNMYLFSTAREREEREKVIFPDDDAAFDSFDVPIYLPIFDFLLLDVTLPSRSGIFRAVASHDFVAVSMMEYPSQDFRKSIGGV